jgi:hypothetical protein
MSSFGALYIPTISQVNFWFLLLISTAIISTSSSFHSLKLWYVIQ